MNFLKKYLYYGISIFALSALGCHKDESLQPMCPPGYTGRDCKTEKVPSKMFLNSVRVISFPARDEHGDKWDIGLFGDPDMYVLVEPTGYGLTYKSGIVENAQSGTVYDYDISPPLEMLNPTSGYRISLYDYDDTSSDDLIGEVEIEPYIANKGFPQFIQINTSNGRCLIEINVAYVWN